MIIHCENCSRKFIVKDSDIPTKGRDVKCGYCSVTWHQMPVSIPTKILKQPDINKPTEEIDEGLSVDKIKASDGKTYKFLGSQWAQLLPSGKTGLFAKRKIGKELDKLTGRKVKGTLHWVSADRSIPAEVRLYDRLFTSENPAKVPDGDHFTDNLNPDSLKILKE